MSSIGKMPVSPIAAVVIVVAVLLAIGIVAGAHFRQPAPTSRAASIPPAPPAVQKQNEQFLTAVESQPPGHRISYVNQQMNQFQGFMASATMAQRQQFAKDLGKH